ncbi:hypothetical protein AVEN_265728-1 [Araneus ventricosus]|uniref:Uncharacterized protein n=1 Tax=Araneus ventricosus TaxID=182803 RepID=A0A4Y2FMA4_ARAVE|nr:hypothetical protein AVEN_265728-1 [Araneus ventricosus]
MKSELTNQLSSYYTVKNPPENSVRRMTILLHRTRMLLAELMFAMYGNANYEPDGDIILESTQIIPQTDEDCLDLVFDEPSWIAQKHRKIGII